VGLLNKLKGGGTGLPEKMTTQEALMVFMCASILADGYADDSEISRMRGLCVRSPIFQNNTDSQDTRLIIKVESWFKNKSFSMADILTKAGASLQAQHKETAFAMACDIAYADGTVDSDEEKLLTDMYQQYVPISEEQAIAIMSTFQSLYQSA